LRVEGSAFVGVPKSLLLMFEFEFTPLANFLVTNNNTLPDEALSNYLCIYQTSVCAFIQEAWQ